MIPTLLGNIVGGSLFVATPYWYLYLAGDAGVLVDFNVGSLASAMEAGGPMQKTTSNGQQVGSSQICKSNLLKAEPNEI